jgi:hypothetical protein
MANDEYRGVVRDGVVEMDHDTPLPDGTEVVVTPVAHPRGTPAAILAAVERSPRVPSEWVDELERMIAEGQRGRRRSIPFTEDASVASNPTTTEDR